MTAAASLRRGCIGRKVGVTQASTGASATRAIAERPGPMENTSSFTANPGRIVASPAKTRDVGRLPPAENEFPAKRESVEITVGFLGSVVIGLVADDGEGAVDLLAEDQAGQAMRQRERGERQPQTGARDQRRG